MTPYFHPQNTPKPVLSLNLQQKKAVEAPLDRPLLIVAGAGTGKTRTLTSRILHLMEKGVPGSRICALTFTNKAAKEMLARVEKGLGGKLKPEHSPYIGTFHALGARILRAECRALGRKPNFVIFDDHDSSQLVKKILKKLEVGKIPEGPAWFLNMISAVKNGTMTLGALKDSGRPNERLAAEVISEYERSLEEQNAFDFDDLIQKIVHLFRRKPDTLAKYRERFSHFLVDEYQDVNDMQYELVRLLAGDSGRVSVVGDDQQTIYSWRGSNFEIFLNFERDWPESQVVLLEENYRSSSNIIRAAQSVIENNTRQKNKKLWTANPEGRKVELWEVGDEDEEAERLVQKILELKEKEPDWSIGVLYRTNAQSRAVEQALLGRRVPYRVYGGLKFYERKEIRDVVAALRAAANPEDALSRERLEKEFGKGRTAGLLEAFSASKPQSPSALLQVFMAQIDYISYLYKNYTNALERRENIMELLRFAAQFEELPPFLDQISLLQATDNLMEAGHKTPVELMTMHLAKGLEFDAVFVAGATEGLLPHARSEGLAELEEERRLLYVAMTRARHALCISFYGLPSRFLGEIPAELIRFESLVGTEEEFDGNDEERYITLD